jgi:hypothetical protein
LGVKHYTYKGPKKNFIIWGLWESKDAEFNVDFTNINIPYIVLDPAKNGLSSEGHLT